MRRQDGTNIIGDTQRMNDRRRSHDLIIAPSEAHSSCWRGEKTNFLFAWSRESETVHSRQSPSGKQTHWTGYDEDNNQRRQPSRETLSQGHDQFCGKGGLSCFGLDVFKKVSIAEVLYSTCIGGILKIQASALNRMGGYEIFCRVKSWEHKGDARTRGHGKIKTGFIHRPTEGTCKDDNASLLAGRRQVVHGDCGLDTCQILGTNSSHVPLILPVRLFFLGWIDFDKAIE